MKNLSTLCGIYGEYGIHQCCQITNDPLYLHVVKTTSTYWNGSKQYSQVFMSGEKHRAQDSNDATSAKQA